MQHNCNCVTIPERDRHSIHAADSTTAFLHLPNTNFSTHKNCWRSSSFPTSRHVVA